jgi:hypothetical protein
LAGSYCEAINAGALPTISTAWSAVINLECQRALDEAARLYVEGANAATRSAGALPDEVRWNAEHARLQEASVRHFRSLAMGNGPEADAKEAKLLELIGAEKGKVDALLGARSEALCEKLVASLLDRFGRCAREATAAAIAAAAASVAAPPAAPAAAAAASPAHALPAALAQLLAEYDRSAHGPSKEAGRAALLTRAAPLMADALAAAEREQARAAAAAQQAAVAARADAAMAMSRVAKAEAAAATHERDVRAAREQLESERARARERDRELESERCKGAAAAAELRTLSATAANKEATLASLRAELERTASTHHTASQQAHAQAQQMELQRQEVVRLTWELTTARTNLEAATRAASTQDVRIAQLEAEVHRLSSQRAASAADVASLRLSSHRCYVP